MRLKGGDDNGVFSTRFGERGCKPCTKVINVSNETRSVSNDIAGLENEHHVFGDQGVVGSMTQKMMYLMENTVLDENTCSCSRLRYKRRASRNGA